MSALFRAAKPDFDRLYRRHVASVYRYAYAVLGNHADAEDVTQQTFLNAYRSISEGTKPRKTENWLLTIAHNEVRRHFRRAQTKPVEVELDEEVADHSTERSDPSLADVVRALQHLPPIQRSALVMREFEGRSYKEIASILNVTQSALEALVFRARRSLAEQLEGALTCAEAEQSVSRRLDGRLPRREARRLKAHLRDCPLCVRFATVQKRQRSLLKGFSIMPIPASLFLFRGEQAAAAALGTGAVATGGSAAAGGGFAAFAGGFAVKAAAVTATVGVAGGVGYSVAKPEPPTATKPKVAQALAVAVPRPTGVGPQVVQAKRADVPHPARPRRSGPQFTAAAGKPKRQAKANRGNGLAHASGRLKPQRNDSVRTPAPKKTTTALAAKKPKRTPHKPAAPRERARKVHTATPRKTPGRPPKAERQKAKPASRGAAPPANPPRRGPKS